MLSSTLGKSTELGKRPLDMWAGALIGKRPREARMWSGVWPDGSVNRGLWPSGSVGWRLGTQNSGRSEEGWYGGMCPGSHHRERSFPGVTVCCLKSMEGASSVCYPEVHTWGGWGDIERQVIVSCGDREWVTHSLQSCLMVSQVCEAMGRNSCWSK